MSQTLRVTNIVETDRFVAIFGQLLFTGAYVAGGESPTFDFATANSASMPVFLNGQTGLHATRPPIKWNVQIESGYAAVLVPGTSSQNFKIKIWDPSTKAEIAAGAYPASMLAAVFNTLEVQYKKNI